MSTFDHKSEFQSPAMNALVDEFGTQRPGAEPLAVPSPGGWPRDLPPAESAKPGPITTGPMPKHCAFCATDTYLILITTPDRQHGICEECVGIALEVIINEERAQKGLLIAAMAGLRTSRDMFKQLAATGASEDTPTK